MDWLNWLEWLKNFDELDFEVDNSMKAQWYSMWQTSLNAWWYIRILKAKQHDFYSVYAKLYKDMGYMEISSSKAKTLPQAKQIASKLYDIVLWYNPPEPWKE